MKRFKSKSFQSRNFWSDILVIGYAIIYPFIEFYIVNPDISWESLVRMALPPALIKVQNIINNMIKESKGSWTDEDVQLLLERIDNKSLKDGKESIYNVNPPQDSYGIE